MTLFLSLRLLSDTALTERSATIGGHSTLPWIPGGALLGACAAILYGRLSPEDAWRVFHSGAVRFGNAFPLGTDGRPSLPIPLSLHAPKGKPLFEGDRLSGDVVNLARADRSEGLQYQQLRGGLLDGTLRRVRLDLRASLRTAVGAGGRAREGFLFSVEALPAGTLLAARIDGEERLLDLVRDSLAEREIFLGRSRSAEFGRARVEMAPSWEDPPRARPAESSTVFWAVSDICLRNGATGQPTFDLNPVSFGLPPSWLLDRARSFIRTRRWSPFNSTRRRPDLERQAIAAGSVLVFHGRRGAPPLDPDTTEEAIGEGIGEYRQEGLGRVVWEPLTLAGPSPRATSSELTSPAEPAATCPKDELGTWLATRDRTESARENAWTLAQDWARDFARRLSGHPLPASQWGEVRRIARRHRAAPNDGLARELQAFVDEGVRKAAWRRPMRGGAPPGVELVRKVREAASSKYDWAIAASALEILCAQVVRHRRGEERGGRR